MHLLYPAAPDDPTRVDETFLAEFEAVHSAGLPCSALSLEELECGNWRVRPVLPEHSQVLYRGWMLREENYRRLQAAVTACGAKLLTSVEQYLYCHHLPNWYPHCRAWTPETLMFPADADLADTLANLNWPAYFIKDYVKSLTTRQGSVASTPEEAADVVRSLERYRGNIEGGICVRRFEQLQSETEERYFVINGTPYARAGVVPMLAREIAARINCPFYSIDLVQSSKGELRLIELGDGQVSDLKQWTPARFAHMLSKEFGT